jgi:hypothetical protein
VLDAFFMRMSASGIPYQNVRTVYAERKPGSSLWDLVVDAVVNAGTKQNMQRWEDDLPKGFLMDYLVVVGQDRIIPFRMGGRECIDRMRGEICGEYHLHGQDEGVGDNEGGAESGGADGEEEEVSEHTRTELGFIDDLRNVSIRY